MARRRIENKRVENNKSRQHVTFCKCRNGLLKKAYDELCAVLCYAKAALVIVFSSRGRLYQPVRQQQAMSSPMKWTTSFRTFLVGSFLLCSVLPVESVSRDPNFYCGNETFEKNSLYEKSLNNIAEKLPAQVSAAPFYFLAISSTYDEPEQIYTAGQCREDNSPIVCQSCIRQAFQDIGVRCPFKKVAAIVYDRCNLWISDRQFIDLNFDSISFVRHNRSRAPVDSQVLGKSVAELVRAVAAETANSASHFATAQQQINGTNGYNLYGFAQCIPRVTPSDCRICLDALITGNNFLQSVGMGSSALWCQFRWELYPFITGVIRTPAEGKHGSSSKHKWKRGFVILSAVGSALLVILIVSAIVLSLQWWRNNKIQKHSSMTTPAGERLKGVETGEGSSSKVPSDAILEIPEAVEQPHAPPTQHPLPTMREACSRMDLTAIHQILFTTHYRDDEESKEVSFDGWTQQTSDVLGAREHGDSYFENKDFRTAINFYSQFVDAGTMVSPTVFARRSLCFLMCDIPDAALRDALQAQIVYPDWPTALYMQAVALSKLNMQSDAVNILNEASQLEAMRRQKTQVH